MAKLEQCVFFNTHQPELSEFGTPLERCLDGQPKQRLWHHFSSPCERFLAGHWEAEPGRWRVQYTEYEYCRILAGRSVLIDSRGERRDVRAGDEFVIPAGFEGEWEVLETTRKTYVIFQPWAFEA